MVDGVCLCCFGVCLCCFRVCIKNMTQTNCFRYVLRIWHKHIRLIVVDFGWCWGKMVKNPSVLFHSVHLLQYRWKSLIFILKDWIQTSATLILNEFTCPNYNRGAFQEGIQYMSLFRFWPKTVLTLNLPPVNLLIGVLQQPNALFS